MDKLNIKALALGIAVPWSLCILSAGWLAPFGWGASFVQTFSSIYIGYGSGWVGGIIGGIEAFFDGAFAGAIIAFIYNWTAKMK